MNGKTLRTSSHTGTKNMETNMLRAPDICKIIKICSECGVSQFSYEGIQINFQMPKAFASQPSPATDFPDTPIEVSEISKQATQDAESFDRAQLLEAEEAQLLIDDPYTFEQTQMDQDVERSRGLDEKTYN